MSLSQPPYSQSQPYFTPSQDETVLCRVVDLVVPWQA